MNTIKTSQLNLKSSRPLTQVEKLRRRLAIYTANLMADFWRTAAEREDLRHRIKVVSNQIRLAELVEQKKRLL